MGPLSSIGNQTSYTYDGLGVRVDRELIVKGNAHGYTGFPLTHTRELLQNIPNKEGMLISARKYSQSLNPPAALSSEDEEK